jgi:peptidase E
MTRRWIVAMGGGAFTAEGTRSPLDDLVVGIARERRNVERPRICFVGTASGDDPGYRSAFRAAYDPVAETDHLTLFDREIEDIEPFLLHQDAIWVGGGNTASMLAVWHAHGVDRALRRAHAAGVVLAGTSAGSICWFESGTTDSYGPTLRAVHGGLGLIAGGNSPHYDGEEQRRSTTHALVRTGELPATLAVDDHAAAVFDGPNLVEVVASHPGPAAFRVALDTDGTVRETRLPVRVLG